jgi:predicted molibdopterin-dependent oxidoreductase YjgC
VAEAAVRRKFERAWGAALPAEPGLSAAGMLAAAGDGRINALYILGEDVLNTSPEAVEVRRGLQACDFVLLQEILPSEAARYADVLLPGASFAEKDGTFTSAERRVQRVRAAIAPPGEARTDGEIIAALARRVLAENGRALEPAEFGGWDYAGPEEVMREITCLAPIYDLVSYERLERGERIQWPAQVGMLTGGELRWMA